jgi:hypothetical protein
MMLSLAVAAALAGCGTSAPVPSASAGVPSQAQQQQDAFRFSGCMRSHGVAGFPDPTAPNEFKQALAPGTTQSPAFSSAVLACQHLLPDGGPRAGAKTEAHGQTLAALAFARCMRERGFTSFPDPTSTGQLSQEMLASAGIDIHQPAAIQAADACTSVTYGLITRAAVARFVAGY